MMAEEAPGPELSERAAPNVALAVRTLAVAGFDIDTVTPRLDHCLVYAHRTDEFGSSPKYCFVLGGRRLGSSSQRLAEAAARQNAAASVVFVGDCDGRTDALTWEQFLGLLGGPVSTATPLEPAFGESLEVLGHNRLPGGLSGSPEDLFERYVAVALEFVVGGYARKYGQQRLFERRSDGLLIMNGPREAALYDAKAYSGGFPIEADDVRRFAYYVSEFQRRYASLLTVRSFLVVSGSFRQSAEAIAARSRDLIAETAVPLVAMDAASLAATVQLLTGRPVMRRAIDWRRVLVEPVFSVTAIEREVETILKDRVVSRSGRANGNVG